MKHNYSAVVFGKNMRYLRRKQGLNQVQMAKILGIGVKSLRSLENGNIPPRLASSFLYKLHATFSVNLETMFTPMDD